MTNTDLLAICLVNQLNHLKIIPAQLEINIAMI